MKQTQSIEEATITLQKWGPLGDVIASFEGERINVFGGIPGETVIAEIVRYKRRRKQYVSGIVRKVLVPSSSRVEPACKYFGDCTGCQWQHINYKSQLTRKTEIVQQYLSNYSSLSHLTARATVSSEEYFNYRNHARFTVRQGGNLGFVNRISRRFIKIQECLIMAPLINQILSKLQGLCQETTQLSIRHGLRTGDWLIQPTLQNPAIDLDTGQTHYTESILGKTFRIASPSFAQVNTDQAEMMVSILIKELELDGTQIIVDAYAGVGTFAVLLASSAKKVIAIEESAAAVADAEYNLNEISNVSLVEGRVETVLSDLDDQPDIVILDPPRVGCYPETLKAILQHTPQRVAYISCNPESLCRDLDILANGGFKIKAVQPIDMFPHTYHIECIALLEK